MCVKNHWTVILNNEVLSKATSSILMRKRHKTILVVERQATQKTGYKIKKKHKMHNNQDLL